MKRGAAWLVRQVGNRKVGVGARRAVSTSTAARQENVWEDLWAAGTPPFHLSNVNANLLQWQSMWLGAAAQREGCDVLMPLSGKSVDMVHLAKAGHRVVGVEFVAAAATQMQAESVPDLQQVDCGNCEHHTVWHSESLPLWLVIGDFMSPAWLAAVSAAATRPFKFAHAWDRGGITSVAPAQRPAYMAQLSASLAPGGTVLMETITALPSADAVDRLDAHPHSPAGLQRAAVLHFDLQPLSTTDVTGDYPDSPHGALLEHVVLLRKLQP